MEETQVKFKVFNQEFNKALGEMKSESSKLRQEFNLQQEQLKLNGTETEKLQSKLSYLQQAHAVAADKVSLTEQQLAKAKVVYGENSVEVESLTKSLLSAQIAEQKLVNQISQTNNSLNKQQQATKDLQTLLKATDSSLEDFSSSLGQELVNSINNGTASTKQLEKAIEKIGKEALGAGTDIDKLKSALKQVDGNGSLDKVKKELNEVAKAANEAEKETGDLGETLGAVAGGLTAGGGMAAVISKSLDTSSLNTKIDISFDVPEESKTSVKEAIKGIEAYGIEGEESLAAVRRQWALNANMTDEHNQKMIKSAGAIAQAYSGIDLNELVQETNELAAELEMGQDDALGMTNALLKMGLPPEQLDILSEYGAQLHRAGYSAEEIQAIFAAGVDTGTWNIDNLLDGLKEGRIKLAEFGAGIDKSTAEVIKGTSISEKQLVSWGKAVASGGQAGKDAMVEVAHSLNGIEDSTKRNEVGVKLFGTMWEDQGLNITNTILGAEEKTVSLKENQELLNASVEKMDEDPAVALEQAFADISTALTPLLLDIANVVKSVAEWAQENPALASTIVAVSTVLAILVGIAMALAPIFIVIAGAGITMAGVVAFLTSPITLAIAAIAALIAIGVAVWQNWDYISVKAQEIWGYISEFFSGLWTSISEIAVATWDYISLKTQEIWTAISTFFIEIWNGIVAFFTPIIQTISDIITNVWNGISAVTSAVWGFITQYLNAIWTAILYFATPIFEGIVNFLSGVWERIKNTVLFVWNMLVAYLTGVWNSILAFAMPIFQGISNFISGVWNGIKSTTTAVWNGVSSTVSGIWNGIKSTASKVWNGLISTIQGPVDTIKSKVTSAFNGLKEGVIGAWDGMKSGIKSVINGIIKMVNFFIDGFNTPANLLDKIPGVDAPQIPKIPLLAKGGKVLGDGAFIAGEAGPELFKKRGNKVSVTPLSTKEKSLGITGHLSTMIANVESTLARTAQNLASFVTPTYAGEYGQPRNQTEVASYAIKPVINVIVNNELDGQAIAQNQFPYINNFLGSDADTNMIFGGVK